MDNGWRGRLIELREERRFSQEHLAEKAGVSQGLISSLETGRRKFTQKTLDKLLSALDANYGDLFQKLPKKESGEGLAKEVAELKGRVKHLEETSNAEDPTGAQKEERGIGTKKKAI